ncbi:hypothetical protein BJ508DRAFT_302239 [Ascobolus immersus RN42]|uniref:Uncharacterized protein n=1 Tax=Ascobolus immersus RN42 TaxID=1160509 RepID=A0A3N4IXG3_ASCIM|nr:hypothetical protein BJ508DRAFT_302239 [Ascobolus immersus RN42]
MGSYICLLLLFLILDCINASPVLDQSSQNIVIDSTGAFTIPETLPDGVYAFPFQNKHGVAKSIAPIAIHLGTDILGQPTSRKPSNLEVERQAASYRPVCFHNEFQIRAKSYHRAVKATPSAIDRYWFPGNNQQFPPGWAVFIKIFIDAFVWCNINQQGLTLAPSSLDYYEADWKLEEVCGSRRGGWAGKNGEGVAYMRHISLEGRPGARCNLFGPA